MKLRELLDAWGLTKLKISAGFLDLEFQPNDQERDAAWSMYVELLTRVTTQALPDAQGQEAAALASVHSLFATTRGILREPGRRHATQFGRLAVVILNQEVRPFTTRWHGVAQATTWSEEQRRAFREELRALQEDLTRYAGLLSELAGVEDLVGLQKPATAGALGLRS